MRIRSQLGVDYSNAYRKEALNEIIDWAIKANEALQNSAKDYAETDTALSASFQNDADIYNKAALSLIAIKRAITE